MDYLITNLLAQMPTGMWEKIIFGFNSSFSSFAISIIILTFCIKLVMIPLDFINRRTTAKTAEMQQKLQPEMDSINKKYRDPSIRNQKIAELYKKSKFSPMGSCLVMLINMGLTLAIFITLLSGLNNMAAYKIQTQFEQLQVSYVQTYVQETYSIDINDVIKENELLEDDNESKKSVYEITLPYIQEIAGKDETVKQTANNSVKARYKEVKESFLWVDNIWLADNPFVNSIASFSDYTKTARLSKEQVADENLKTAYEQIYAPLKDNSRVNGYFLLVILCGGTAFLSQWLLTRKNKNMSNGSNPQMSGKTMLIIMPLIMTVFTLFYTSMFSLYVITSQLVSIATIPLINLIIRKIDAKKRNKNVPDNRMKRIGE